MTVSLLPYAAAVKKKLVDFGLKNFQQEYQSTLKELFPEHWENLSEEEQLVFTDWFVLECMLPDMRTVLSYFIERWPDEADISIAEQWGTVIEGVFQVKQIMGPNYFQLCNFVNDVNYIVAAAEDVELPLEKGEYIRTKIISFQDYHIFTGLIEKLQTRKKDEIYQVVSEIQLQKPRMAFIDNLGRLELAYKIQHEEYNDFMTFFGTDEIVLMGGELEEKMKEFYHYRYFQKKLDRSGEGQTMAKTFQERYHQLPLPPSFDFIPQLEQTSNVGVLYDKTEGMVFLLHYGDFKEVFENPPLRSQKHYREILQGYLDDPHISSLPFRRMAKAYPENTVEVFKGLLKRKRFDLEKDLPKLIAKHKPMEQLTRFTPASIPSLVRSKTFLKSLKAGHKW